MRKLYLCWDYTEEWTAIPVTRTILFKCDHIVTHTMDEYHYWMYKGTDATIHPPSSAIRIERDYPGVVLFTAKPAKHLKSYKDNKVITLITV